MFEEVQDSAAAVMFVMRMQMFAFSHRCHARAGFRQSVLCPSNPCRCRGGGELL